MSADTQRETGLKVIVSEDRLKAWIALTNPAVKRSVPDEAVVLAALEAAQIPVNDSIQARLREYLALATPTGDDSTGGPPELPERFLIAEGRPPVEAEDGRFEQYDKDEADASVNRDAASVDYFRLSLIKTVQAGEIVGRIRSPTQGVPGLDVFGREVSPRRRNGDAIKPGPGLRLTENDEVVADIPGRILVQGGKPCVEEILDINGDINFETGSLDVCVNVNVHGTVQSNFRVRTTKSLTVDKAVEAAEVDVEGDILVRGGICGAERTGKVSAGGSIAARFCNEADVQAGGDFRFDKETINSRIRAKGRILSQRGTIIGGQLWAREGVEAGVLGSEAGVATSISVGIPIDVLRRARQLEQQIREQRRMAEQIRQKVQPLMADLKRLSAQQREVATELLSKADEIELGLEAREQERQQILENEAPAGKPYVLAQVMIHPGVRIGIEARETVFDRPMHGPVRVERRKINDVTEIAAVNQRTGSVTVLRSTDVNLDAAVEENAQDSGGQDASQAGVRDNP